LRLWIKNQVRESIELEMNFTLPSANPVMTPVRLTATDRAVYVAGGELDRVVAFRLESDGMPVDAAPFSRTDQQTNSFPNDVAVAMLSAACE